MKNDQTISEVSAYFAVGVFTLIMIALLLILMKVWRLIKKLDEESVEEFTTKYAKLTESLKETKVNMLVYMWRPLNLLRWFLTLGILLTLKG